MDFGLNLSLPNIISRKVLKSAPVSNPVSNIGSTAQGAFSFRKVSQTYDGNVIRVRRSSDNTEQDIGFFENSLDIVSLESFCAGTDGFIAIWYDQSGNSSNATQISTAYQPKIVNNGSTILVNGKPSILPVNGSTHLRTSIAGTSTSSIFNVLSCDPLSDSHVLLGNVNSTSNYLLIAQKDSTSSLSTVTPVTYVDGALRTFQTRGELYTAIENQSILSVEADLSTFTSYSIGFTLSVFSVYKLQEMIIYGTNKSSERLDIEANMNSYFNVY